MFRSKAGLVIFALAFIVVLVIPYGDVSGSEISRKFPLGATPRVAVGPEGAIHLLWTIPSVTEDGLSPGVWYSRFEANGTNSVPLKMIWNSTLVQSADMAVDSFGNLHIIWADGPALAARSHGLRMGGHSRVYYAEINSTHTQVQVVSLAGTNELVLWPAIAVDANLTTHFVWSQLDPDGETNPGAYYAMMSASRAVNRTMMISPYNQSLLTIPRPHMAWDGSSSLHVAWAETDQVSGERIASSIFYSRMDLSESNLTRIKVAEFDEPVQDATVTPGPEGGAYVVWQFQDTSKSPNSVFVSQISKSGRIAFSKQIRHPDLQDVAAPYLALSSGDNLYVVWYRGPQSSTGKSPQDSLGLTSVSYTKVDYDGSIEEAKNELVNGPVVAATVSKSGELYVISQGTIIRLNNPNGRTDLQFAVIAGLTVSSLAGAIATEDGKYRIARLLIRAGDKSSRYQTEAESDAALLKLIYRKPGSRLRDLKHLASRKDPLTLKLARLESAGYIASSRKGWARQFYVHPGIEPIEPSTRGLSLTIPSSILIEIARNPGIWEAKLVTALGESQQIVHYHLKKLREANLIVSEDDGKRKLYKLSQKNCSQPPPIEPNT